MFRSNYFAFSILLALLCVPGAQSQKQKTKTEDRQDYYRKWLEEDVVYIIALEEKAVFMKLNTPEEKDAFIQQFWARRDPDPTKPSNEFKEEHYRRLQYVNERFASGKQGWRTDRGRFYIRFGKPDGVESHPGGPYIRKPNEGGGKTSVYPFERWRYRHIDGIGDNIEVEFVDSSMTGNYELALDADEKDALFNVPGAGNTWDEDLGKTTRSDRVQYRFWGNPNNLDKGEDKFAYKRLEDQFYYRYERMISLEKPPVLQNPKLREAVDARVLYPATLPLSYHHVFYRLGDREYLVPISLKVQNRELSYVTQPEGYLSAKVDVYARVMGIDGTIYYEFDDTIYSHYSPEEFPKRNDQYSVYERTLKLRPGRYKIDLLVQTDQGRKSSLSTFSIALPSLSSDASDARLSPLLLSHYISLVVGTPQSWQFVIGDLKVVPAFDNVFMSTENIGVYLQGYGFQSDSSSAATPAKVRFRIQDKEGRIVREALDDRGSCIRSAGSRLVIAELLPLTGLQKGRYRLTVLVEDRITGKVQAESADFEIAG
jgi:GWxTD domain-containing protein